MPESARVVVIDDDEAVLDSVRVLLELEGFNVETFGQASTFCSAAKVSSLAASSPMFACRTWMVSSYCRHCRRADHCRQ